ncbi:N-acetyl-gamma-glutamyl-phosphate reductase [Rhodoplanes serenus]|uniref:N-acetyl-gamma-glutamyl-phosphate reductase n=1 Tax=Rhodoplanes serenus TaxID=200615 RepID=A0A9X4XS15_9BRAD|nr:N-acetyl-gamma-glutamyl-phosphate reductase [Rhodoplanes serenus]MTW18734.1 N-acetyl-gamma-glutamyl-phosphate reductase [Rhodoplanes serenus]
MAERANIGILGASGYTGSELLRLLLRHPRIDIALLTADRRAGQTMRDVFPQFSPYALPRLVAIDDLDWPSTGVDLVFCALPHGTTQAVIDALLTAAPHVKVVDLSADFRLFDADAYARWYGHAHRAEALQREAVYGLVEVYREKIKGARLVANPGCYTTCAQLPLLPLIRAGAIAVDEIVIDAKSGVTGAGRAAKEANLFTEVSEGFHAYGVGHHRHMAELDQEFSKAAGRPVVPTFTPHLVPMNRGILSTIYVRGSAGQGAEELHAILVDAYADEPFVHVLPFGEMPQTRHVRGSNMTFIGVAKDRLAGRAIIGSALDNLVKGASGQAVQNMNLMLGYPETLGLEQVALFP